MAAYLLIDVCVLLWVVSMLVARVVGGDPSVFCEGKLGFVDEADRAGKKASQSLKAKHTAHQVPNRGGTSKDVSRGPSGVSTWSGARS